MMTELLDVLHALGQWSLPVIWLPMLAWTLLALPVYLVLRHATGWHPLVRYRLLQALIVALPVGLLAAAWLDASELSGWLFALFTSSAKDSQGLVVVPFMQVGASATEGTFTPSQLTVYHAAGAFTGIAFLLAAVRLLRLVRSGLAISQFHVSAPDANVQHRTNRLADALGIGRSVTVRTAADPVVPLTYGLVRPTIVLPASLTAHPDKLRMTLIHELIHIRRYDFLARCAEQFVATVFAIHPGVAHLARSIEPVREIACDAEAIRRSRCSRKAYADLLCGFTASSLHSSAFVLSIAETSSSLKQRIQAMTTFDRLNNHFARFTPLLAAALLALLGLGIVACSDAVTPPEEASSQEAATQQSEQSSKDVFVTVEEPPTLKEGMQAISQEMRYPEAAKEAGIEGRVFVQFIVDEQGNVIQPEITEGVNESLNKEALRVVKTLKFEPGKQRGEPVKVQMAIPITFKLSENDSGG